VVLNTRAAPQAAELSRLLRAAGFEVIEAAAIAIEPAWATGAIESIRQALDAGAFSWVVLASQNAGHGLEWELRRAGDRVICGAATARALQLDRARAVERFSASAALDLLQPLLLRGGERVLVPRAAEGRDELVEGLRAADVDVEVVAPIAYRTVPSAAAADRLRQGGIDVVTLCSPSAARAVASAVGDSVRVVCLGQTTATAAGGLGMRVDRVAASTSMAALVQAVEVAVGAEARA
jgi:uroporphyrinogen-III synthase